MIWRKDTTSFRYQNSLYTVADPSTPKRRGPWMPSDTRPVYTYGLDLGRNRDCTALAMLERRWRQADADEFLRTSSHGEWEYTIRRLDVVPLGTSYVDVAEWVKSTMTGKVWDPEVKKTLVVDATGVGTAVMDVLQRVRIPGTLVGGTITGGTAAGHGISARTGSYTVSRVELLDKLRVAVEEGAFRIAKDCKETRRLIEEVAELKSEGGKSAKGDDLAFAVALAVWWGLKGEMRG